METHTIVLSDELKASSRGKPIESNYRAVLIINPHRKLVVQIEQFIRGEWSGCGRWGLSTLLYSYPVELGNKPSDSLSIDYGQEWQIEAGMLKALQEAINHI